MQILSFALSSENRPLRRCFIGLRFPQYGQTVLEEYLRRFGRPLEFYTDKASIFHTTPKKNHPVREEPLPPTQIGRALQELGIGWIAAHSPQAKGRVKGSFDTAHNRLVKLMRAEGVTTLEQANEFLDQQYIPEWERLFTSGLHAPMMRTGHWQINMSWKPFSVVYTSAW